MVQNKVMICLISYHWSTAAADCRNLPSVSTLFECPEVEGTSSTRFTRQKTQRSFSTRTFAVQALHQSAWAKVVRLHVLDSPKSKGFKRLGFESSRAMWKLKANTAEQSCKRLAKTGKPERTFRGWITQEARMKLVRTRWLCDYPFKG